jgi:hypothetical protein
MTDPTRTEFVDRARALEQRLSETSDFVESRWREIEDARIRRLELKQRWELYALRLEHDRRLYELQLWRDRLRWALVLFALIPLILVPFISGAHLIYPAYAALVVFGLTLALDRSRYDARSHTPTLLLLSLMEAGEPISRSKLSEVIEQSPKAQERMIEAALDQGMIELHGGSLSLTEFGRTVARRVSP